MALDGLRAHIGAGRRRVLLVAPTGAGKTTIAAAMIHGAVARGSKVLFLAHRKELIDQCSERLDGLSVAHGVIMAKHPRWQPWRPVQVASVQTLRTRQEKPEAQLLVIDEAHHARAATYGHILDSYPGAPVVGLTATPWRTDGKPLGDLFETSVIAATTAQLVDRGFLVPCTGYAFDTPDLSGVRRTAGDYNDHDLEAIMAGSRIVGNVVQQWATRAKGLKTVLFACTVQHSQRLVDEFKAAGVPAEHLDGKTPRAEREAILRRLFNGQTQIVSNVGVLTEGWDCPPLGCVILARPTLSLGLYLQMVGRGRRPAPGKERLLIHDHAGCVLRHGLPDAERDYSLSPAKATGKRFDATPDPVRQCGQCFGLYDPALEACPLCGWQNPKRVRSIEEVDGVAIAFEEIGRGHDTNAPENVKREAFQRYSQEAASKGYKPGWVSYRFRYRFGHWPPKEWSANA